MGGFNYSFCAIVLCCFLVWHRDDGRRSDREMFGWILKHIKHILSVALFGLLRNFQAEFCDWMAPSCRKFGNVTWGMDLDGNFEANIWRSTLPAWVTRRSLSTISTFALRPKKPRKFWFNWPAPGLFASFGKSINLKENFNMKLSYGFSSYRAVNVLYPGS